MFQDQEAEARRVLQVLQIAPQPPSQAGLPKKRSFTERAACSDDDAELLGSERSGGSKRCRKTDDLNEMKMKEVHNKQN